MQTRLALAFVAAISLAAGIQAQAPPQAREETPVVKPAAALKWSDLDPVGAPGVKIASLWGRHDSGAFGAMFKLPAGFATPLHTHTHEMKVVIVSGTYVQAPEGKEEFRLGPGSYLMQPGGTYRHTTRCDEGAECVFFVESDGPFDLRPAPAKDLMARR